MNRFMSIGSIGPSSIILTILVAALSIGTPHVPSHSRQPDRSPRTIRHTERTLPLQSNGNVPGTIDSVTVLLFAQAPPTIVALSSSDRITINGQGLSDRHIRASIGTGRVWIGGEERQEWRITAEGNRTIRLESNGRVRRVRGTIEISASGHRLLVTARMSATEYLVATLGAETTANDPMEYLVALSVLQRNYLATHRRRHAPAADLCDNSHCQVVNLTPNAARLREAVDRAMKIALEADGGLPCYYSANCGGSTLTPQRIWHTAEPGYSEVRCIYCARGKWHRWSRSTEATPELDRAIRESMTPPFIDDDFKIRIGRMIGFNIVLSNTVDRIERRNGRFVFSGRGFGHRVGLCCDGARQLARNGRRAVDILRFYFPDARLTLR